MIIEALIQIYENDKHNCKNHVDKILFTLHNVHNMSFFISYTDMFTKLLMPISSTHYNPEKLALNSK